jgi:hypothetical protein
MTPKDEYELFLGHVNDLTERRKSVTATYLSVNAALTAAIAFLFKDGPLQGWAQQVSVLVLLISGISACTLWRRLIGQYSAMIGWWYGRLRDLECSMPNCSKAITREHREIYSADGGKSTRRLLSVHETRLVWIFTFIYTAFSLGIAFVLVSSFAKEAIR